MNDKLFVFKSVFYGAVPQYQRVFLEKKQKALEDKLKEEKAAFEKEMNAMSSKARRKMLKKHPEMLHGGAGPTAPNKYQDSKGRDGSGSNELLGLPSLEQPRGSGVTAQQMIDKLRTRKKLAPAEPHRGLNVKSRYLSTLTTSSSANPEAKRATSSADAPRVRRGSLASSGHSRSRPGPLAVNPKVEKPSFEVAADHRIKEADEQDETMTPMPKRYANRLEAKQAYAAQREEQGKLVKLQQPRSESSRERSVTLGDRGCGASRVAAAEEELRADDASILHISAPGLPPGTLQADSSATKGEQLKRLLAAGPLPETDRGQAGPTRTLSLGNIEKKFSNSNHKLLGSFGARRSEQGPSGSLRQIHRNAPKMSGLASSNSFAKSRQAFDGSGGGLAATAYHTGPARQKQQLTGVPPHLRHQPRPEKNRPYGSGKPSSAVSLNARS